MLDPHCKGIKHWCHRKVKNHHDTRPVGGKVSLSDLKGRTDGLLKGQYLIGKKARMLQPDWGQELLCPCDTEPCSKLSSSYPVLCPR